MHDPFRPSWGKDAAKAQKIPALDLGDLESWGEESTVWVSRANAGKREADCSNSGLSKSLSLARIGRDTGP